MEVYLSRKSTVVLSLKDNKFYIGYTANIDQRINQHINGEVSSTKERRPLKLIYYETYFNKFDALKRERYFKTTKGKAVLRNMLKNSLKNNP